MIETSPVVSGVALEELRRLAAQVCERDDFAQVLTSLEEGHGGTLGGVWGSARALVAASLAARCSGPLFVVTPHHAEVDKLLDDLRLFTDLTVEAFPAWQSDPGERVLHDEVYGQRIRILKALTSSPSRTASPSRKGGEPPRIIVTSIHGLMQPVPGRDQLAEATRRVSVGEAVGEETLARWLVDHGCHATSAVELPGEFAVRGGIVDVFPPDGDHPVRIEFFGDEIESIRRFDVATQRSLGTVESVDITLLAPSASDRAHLTLYAPPESWFLLVEPTDLDEEGKFYLERTDDPRSLHSVRTSLAEVYKFPSVTASGVPAGSLEPTCHLGIESVERFSGDVQRSGTSWRASRTGKRCSSSARPRPRRSGSPSCSPRRRCMTEGRLKLVIGSLAEGFRVVAERAIVLASGELFHRHDTARGAIRQVAGRAIDSFLELREGDLVVHVTHGIGRYRGHEAAGKRGTQAKSTWSSSSTAARSIYVPASKIELVQKYVGGARRQGRRWRRIGGKAWVRQKTGGREGGHRPGGRHARAAGRAATPGPASPFPHDTPWQTEFDAAFPYQETPDQLRAIDAIKDDMDPAAADGPAAVRRRRLRQDRGGDAGGVQGGRRRLPGGRAGADHRPGRAAPAHVHRADGRVPVRDRLASAGSAPTSSSDDRRAAGQGGAVDIVIGTHRLASARRRVRRTWGW